MPNFNSFRALSFHVETEHDLRLEFEKKLLTTNNKELSCTKQSGEMSGLMSIIGMEDVISKQKSRHHTEYVTQTRLQTTWSATSC